MKKIFTFIIALSCFGFSMAQPALNSITVPAYGTTVSAQIKSDNTVDPGSVGANQDWDFSDVSFTGLPVFTTTVENPATTPYTSSFPTANYSEQTTQGNYAYYAITSTSEVLQGLYDVSSGTAVVYSDPINIIQFPLSYNSTQEDDFSSSSTVNGVQTTITGTYSVKYDGYGTLKTVNGTYNNVVRLKSTKTENNTMTVGSISITTTTTSVTYGWTLPGSNISLFAIMDVTISTSLGQSSSSRSVVLYQTEAATAITKSALQNLDIAVGPNPAAESVTVDFKDLASDHYDISLTDERGITVYQENTFVAYNGRHTINIANFPKGVYTMRVASATGGKTSRIVKY